MSCSKRKYDTEVLAINALMDARIKFVGNNATGVYLCDKCGYWHLTSKGELHPNLKSDLESGKIKKEQQAFFWEKKFRKK
jgi:hypothetical protein